MPFCWNNETNLDLCLNRGKCDRLDDRCICSSACFVGNFCEINYNAVRLPMTGAIVQDAVATRDYYIATFVILAACGLINNACALITFCRERIRITAQGFYLIVFSIMSIFLMCVLVTYCLTVARLDSESYRIISCFGLPFISLIMVDGSILCTVAVAIERVLIESFDFAIHGSRVRSVLVSLGIIVYACGSNIDEIFLRRLTKDLEGKHICIYDFDQYPTWRRIDIIFSYAHVIIPCFVHLICAICILTTIARRKIFIGTTNKSLVRVWMHQLNFHRDLLIPPVAVILCILPHGILGHLLQTCIPYSDKPKLRLHIAFVLLLYVPQMLSFMLYVYPKNVYMGEFRQTFIYRIFCRCAAKKPKHHRRYLTLERQ